MNSSLNTSKRNRSGNFDNEDIQLFLGLVSDNKSLIESGKQEDKKKGWDAVHEGFNASCSGAKRDVNSLKMKLKNLKAQNKKSKLNEGKAENGEDNHASDQDEPLKESDQKTKTARKRTKMFSAEETSLLQELVEKYLNTLDTSLTRDSIDSRNKAWDSITEEFNWANVNDIPRDQLELKTKLKNLKAQRFNFKTEQKDGQAIVQEIYYEPDPLDSEEKVSNIRTSARNIVARPSNPPRQKRTNASILDSLDPDMDYTDDDDDDYVLPIRKTFTPFNSKPNPSDDKEEQRIRKENLLLKNAVLKKKERLLELQIALAERNLRRHQL